MSKDFYVIDSEDNTTWHGREKDDCPQRFATFAAAEKRAKELADIEPGKEVKIAKIVGVVLCAVQPAKTRRIP